MTEIADNVGLSAIAGRTRLVLIVMAPAYAGAAIALFPFWVLKHAIERVW